jgi:hypothetical protein
VGYIPEAQAIEVHPSQDYIHTFLESGQKDRDRCYSALHGAADAAIRVSLTESGQIQVEFKNCLALVAILSE